MRPECPGNGHGFTADDWTVAQAQINLEMSYLKEVLSYQSLVNEIYEDADKNLATELTGAAAQVAHDLNKATGQPVAKIELDPLTLGIDSISTLAGVTNMIGVAAPPVEAISGALSTAGAILSIIKDAQKTSHT